MRHRKEGLSRLVDETLTGHRSRREVIRQATALGLSAPLVAAGLTQQRRGAAAAQDATPMAAPPSGEPIAIGAAVSSQAVAARMQQQRMVLYMGSLMWMQRFVYRCCDA